MTKNDDTELVNACRNGSREAFDELVRRYQGPVYNLALRILGNVDDAMDATQTTFLNAYRRLDSFDATRRFFNWLYSIAVHEALDVRARRGRATEVPVGDELSSPAANPEVELAGKDSERRLLKALRGLSAEERALVALRHFQGLSYAEIAETMSLSIELVRSRLFSARQRLRRTLDRQVGGA